MARLGLVAAAAAVGILATFPTPSVGWTEDTMEYGVGSGKPKVPFHRVRVDAGKTGAVCLDGSSPTYYISKGFGEGADKWYIHHQGGGWCESLADCAGRSRTLFGSTKNDPPVVRFGSFFGSFSNLSSTNALMYNWNKVLLRYCDGGSFSGDNSTVANYKGTDLHFRGFRILKLLQERLYSNGMKSATDVVIGGCSAGGLATYLHLEWWRSLFPKSVNMVGMPDSGYFLDLQYDKANVTVRSNGETTIPGNLRRGMEYVFEQQNATSGLNAECVSTFQKEGLSPFPCIFAQHTSPFLRTPIFALQSMYDSWQTAHVLPNSTDTLVTEFGALMRTALAENLLTRPQHGYFLDACHHHCGGWNDAPVAVGYTHNTAVKKFYDDYLQGKPAPRFIVTIGGEVPKYPCTECKC